VGSRNIGATNAYRVLGARWGILVFFFDAVKGFLAASMPMLVTAVWWATLFPQIAPDPQSLAAWDRASRVVFPASLAGGIAAILGHTFSPWLRFRGGRGVATSLGVFLAIIPVPTLLAFAVWVLLMILTRRVSVGSIGAALAYPFLVWFLLARDPHRIVLTVITALVSILVIVRHKANIQRLLAGTEPPLRRGGSSAPGQAR
jgi:acyl phosphate:glycerol-3-phosphate acyltransferase